MNYEEIVKDSRKKVLELVWKAQTSHIGSLFSCADIMAVLFEKMDLEKDKFVLSAGWKACMLYYHLWRKGRITEEELNSYCQEGSRFIGLAEPIHKDIPFAGGSMCMGLAAGVGFALAKKLKGEEGKVYVLESDGGMQGGITWEAIAIASQHNLDNLVLLVDDNEFQAMGKTNDILDQRNLPERIRAFGWFDVQVVDGHDYESIETAIIFQADRPLCIIFDTIKGKGVSFMERNNLYHYKAPSEEEYKKALQELNV